MFNKLGKKTKALGVVASSTLLATAAQAESIVAEGQTIDLTSVIDVAGILAIAGGVVWGIRKALAFFGR